MDPVHARPAGTQNLRQTPQIPGVDGVASLVEHLFGGTDAYQHQPRPTKRARLDPERWWRRPEDMEAFCAVDPDIEDAVDLTALDYLAFRATASVIETRITELTGSVEVDWSFTEREVAMVDDWLRYWLATRAENPRITTQNTSFRVRLLQFVVLFGQRLHRVSSNLPEESLVKIRAKAAHQSGSWKRLRSAENRANADKPIGSDGMENSHGSQPSDEFDPRGEYPLDEASIIQNRSLVFHDLSVTDPDPERWIQDFYGTPACPRLADLLSEFMSLSVANSKRDRNMHPTMEWMELVAEWMLQAAVEAYLMVGVAGEVALQDCFAFGHIQAPQYGIQDHHQISALFADEAESDEEHPAWTELREVYFSRLRPKTGSSSSLQVMKRAFRQFPPKQFELRVLQYLRSLHDMLPRPDLQQVEDGKIEGLSEQESQAMLRRMGL